MGANRHGSKWIRPEKRKRIYARDAYRCVYCGGDFRQAYEQCKRSLTLDHLQARSHGGGNHESNLVTCCLTCNSRKRDTCWREFVGNDGGVVALIMKQVCLPLNTEGVS